MLNKHFVNSVRCLAEKGDCCAHVLNISDDKDPLNIVTIFQLHPSIKVIKQKDFKEVFDFTLLTTEEVLSEFNKFDPTKSTTASEHSELCIKIIQEVDSQTVESLF